MVDHQERLREIVDYLNLDNVGQAIEVSLHTYGVAVEASEIGGYRFGMLDSMGIARSLRSRIVRIGDYAELEKTAVELVHEIVMAKAEGQQPAVYRSDCPEGKPTEFEIIEGLPEGIAESLYGILSPDKMVKEALEAVENWKPD